MSFSEKMEVLVLELGFCAIKGTDSAILSVGGFKNKQMKLVRSAYMQ